MPPRWLIVGSVAGLLTAIAVAVALGALASVPLARSRSVKLSAVTRGGHGEPPPGRGPLHVVGCETIPRWRSQLACHGLEARMGNKDKGGKNTKTVAAKGLKQKRQDKKAKRAANDAKKTRVA